VVLPSIHHPEWGVTEHTGSPLRVLPNYSDKTQGIETHAVAVGMTSPCSAVLTRSLPSDSPTSALTIGLPPASPASALAEGCIPGAR